jgi:GntR family transcriptional regulator
MTRKPPFTLQLDFRSGLPIYIQIRNHIQQRILSGSLKPGDQLPTVRTLALALRVNFNTVARTYRLLDEARLLSTQQGRGTYVSQRPPREQTGQLSMEALQALTDRYINEARLLNFSGREMTQALREQLQARKEKQQT